MMIQLLKPQLNYLVKDRYASYTIKELYRHFDRENLDELNAVFLVELDKNVKDKYAICIFKEMIHNTAGNKQKLFELLTQFLKLYKELKLDTFYHFGLQYFLEVSQVLTKVVHSSKFEAFELGQALQDFVKLPKNLFRSRATSATILLGISKPPTPVCLVLMPALSKHIT